MIDHQTITETLQELLPGDVELSVDSKGKVEYVAHFNWPIKTDPERPYKRSKTVLLKINEHAMADLQRVGVKREAKTLIDLETYLKNQLYQFEPDHSSPRGQPEPVEKWEIDSLHFLDVQKPLKGVKRRLF